MLVKLSSHIYYTVTQVFTFRKNQKNQDIAFSWLHTIKLLLTAKICPRFSFVVIILLNATAPGVNEYFYNLVWYSLILVTIS